MPRAAELSAPGRAAITGNAIRRIVLEQSKRANVGHIGSALSIADIVAALYGGVLRIADPDDPDRDRFVLSKGHAVLAVYAALALRGWLAAGRARLATAATAALLGVHPEHALPGIDFSTGLARSRAVDRAPGAALAARLQRSARRGVRAPERRRVQRGLGVGGGHVRGAPPALASSIAIVDLNGQQALGYTTDVLSLSPMADRWRAFGWDVHEVDGHDRAALADTIARLDTAAGPPHVLVARTVFGKGVSYMERQIKWHYRPMSDDEYRQALAEIEAQER